MMTFICIPKLKNKKLKEMVSLGQITALRRVLSNAVGYLNMSPLAQLEANSDEVDTF